MRLIDADKLLKHINYICDGGGYSGAVIHAIKVWMESIVAEEPIVIYLEHGEWLDYEGFNGEDVYVCSKCSAEFVLIEGTPKDNEYNYCPKCGAKMDGEVEE